jgi:short-subunit dehydrogenase
MGHTARRTRFFFTEPEDVARAGIHALEQRRRTFVPASPHEYFMPSGATRHACSGSLLPTPDGLTRESEAR